MGKLAESLRGGTLVARWFLGVPFFNLSIIAKKKTRREIHEALARRATRTLEAARVAVELDGEPPPPGRGCVVVYNETAFPDVWAFQAAMWPHLERGSGTDVLALLPFTRAVCARAGIELIPQKDRAGVDKALANMVDAVKAGERVAWGGEGRLSGKDEVLRFKVGSALIAIRAQAPLVPVAFRGGHAALPLGSIRSRPGKVRVRFGAPIPTTGLGENDARALADRAQAALAAMFADLAPA